MKKILFLILLLNIPGCKTVEEVKYLEHKDKDQYAGVSSMTSYFVGPVNSSPLYGEFTIENCLKNIFDTPQASFSDEVISEAADLVCKQYGIDLRDFDESYLACFEKDKKYYKHPWLAKNPSEKCKKFSDESKTEIKE